jgi:hypothetical protein
MVFARSGAGDTTLQFGADSVGPSKQLFALSKTKTKKWKVGKGWLYCGLTKVDVTSAELPESAEKAYINVTESDGEFAATISEQEDVDAVVSIVLYEFKNNKLKLDGRNVIFVPLYN